MSIPKKPTRPFSVGEVARVIYSVNGNVGKIVTIESECEIRWQTLSGVSCLRYHSPGETRDTAIWGYVVSCDISTMEVWPAIFVPHDWIQRIEDGDRNAVTTWDRLSGIFTPSTIKEI